MNIRNTIIKHYKKFFDLHAKGIALTEDDHLDIDWAESLVKDCFISDVSQRSELLISYTKWLRQRSLYEGNFTEQQLAEAYDKEINCA